MKSFGFVGMVVIVSVWASSLSANEWTGAVNTRWDEPGNWSQNVVPAGSWQHPSFGWDDPSSPLYPLTPNDPNDDFPLENNNAQLRYQGGGVPTEILIDENTEHPVFGTGLATAYGVRVGNGGGDVTLRIDGGRLEIGGEPSSGGDPVGWHFDIGRGFQTHNTPDSVQRVVMTGGEVVTQGLLIPEQFVDNSLPDPTDSAPLNGVLEMSGGTVTARWMNLGQLKGNGTVMMSGDAVINVFPNLPSDRNNGGHFSFNRNWFLDGIPVPSSGNVHLDLSDDATINIFGHRDEFLNTPNQSEVDRYLGYIPDFNLPPEEWGNEILTAWGGTEAPVVTLQACPEDPDPLAALCTNDGGMMITITAPELTELIGDYNDDGMVGAPDLGLVLGAWGSDMIPAEWVNQIPMGGTVGADQLSPVLQNWGTTAAVVPEPAAAWTLAVVVLLVWTRRQAA